MVLVSERPPEEALFGESPPPPVISPSMRYPGLYEAMCLAEIREDGIDIADLEIRDGFTDEIIMENWRDLLAQPRTTMSEEVFNWTVRQFAEEHFIFPERGAGEAAVMPESESVHDYCLRVMHSSVRHPYRDTVSQIGVRHPVLEPGGRFGVPQEGMGRLFYWDSAPTLRGAVALDKEWGVARAHDTLRNFEELADRLGGCIPNVNATWAASRSQHPNLTEIVQLLVENDPAGEQNYITYLPLLEKHFNFWRDGADDGRLGAQAGSTHRRVVRMENGSFMYRYWDDADGPREEMYLADLKTLYRLRREVRAKERRELTDYEVTRLFKSLRASAESGEDFRLADTSDKKNLHNLRTVERVSVKLNGQMYDYANMLAKAWEVKAAQAPPGSGEHDMAKQKVGFYKQEAANLKTCIETYCMSEDDYLADYDFVNQRTEPGQALAAIYALKAGVFDQKTAERLLEMTDRRFKLQDGSGLVNTRYFKSKEQWDANVWPIMQLAAIDAAMRYGRYDLAYGWAKRWLNSQDKMFKKFSRQWEKAAHRRPGHPGGAGEYACVENLLMTLGSDATARAMLPELKRHALDMRKQWRNGAIGNIAMQKRLNRGVATRPAEPE